MTPDDLYKWSLTADPIQELPVAYSAVKSPMMFNYQVAAAQQILHARRHTYCAHHPGAGKTPIALVASLAYSLSDPVLVVCPPAIVYQWAMQAYKWTGVPWIVCASTSDILAFLSEPRKQVPCRFIVPDSLVHEIPPVFFDFVIVDEAHRLKTRDARRTRAVFGSGMESGIAQRTGKILCMSGTPMPSNPTELYPFLNTCAPEIAPSFGAFSARYCPPVREWVWRGKRRQEILVYKHAINKDELARKLRETVMIRPLRSDILAQLPALREERFTLKLGIKTGRTVETILAEWKRYGDKDPALATERKDLGQLKAKAAIPYLETVIDGGDTPVIWTWHRAAAEDIASALKIPLVIGGMPASDIRDALESFTGGRARAIVCTIGAAGTGVDGLQHRTDLAIFVERSYTSHENEQAIARLWRTGQRNSVRIVFIDADHPIDGAIEQINLRKSQDQRDIIGG